MLLLNFKFFAPQMCGTFNVYGEYEKGQCTVSEIPGTEETYNVPNFKTLSITTVAESGEETEFVAGDGKTNEDVISSVLLLITLKSSFCEVIYMESGLAEIIKGFAEDTAEVKGCKAPKRVFFKGEVFTFGFRHYKQGEWKVYYRNGNQLICVGLTSGEIFTVEAVTEKDTFKVDSS